MKPFPKRVLINPTLALVLVGGTVLWVAPYIVATRQMEHFCDTLPRGASIDQVQSLARSRGYELSNASDAQAELVDPKAFGRRQCGLQFGPSGLTATHFNTGS